MSHTSVIQMRYYHGGDDRLDPVVPLGTLTLDPDIGSRYRTRHDFRLFSFSKMLDAPLPSLCSTCLLFYVASFLENGSYVAERGFKGTLLGV